MHISRLNDCDSHAHSRDAFNNRIEEFKDFIKNLKIIARCSPEHRYQLAKTLKQLNMVTCFSGDNIGDSFAMEESDVGLTMKYSGSGIAKKRADLIVDDDFRLILETIKLGRNMYENMRKFIQFQATISINLALYFTIGSLEY